MKNDIGIITISPYIIEQPKRRKPILFDDYYEEYSIEKASELFVKNCMEEFMAQRIMRPVDSISELVREFIYTHLNPLLDESAYYEPNHNKPRLNQFQITFKTESYNTVNIKVSGCVASFASLIPFTSETICMFYSYSERLEAITIDANWKLDQISKSIRLTLI